MLGQVIQESLPQTWATSLSYLNSVTTIQDYSLFHILNEYSIDFWKRQIELILQGHGLVSFIVHPDHILEKRARATYAELLD